jgi:hypothetical protein
MSALLSLAACLSPPRAQGPLDEHAYVWQRQWTEPVARAVEERGPTFSRLLLLAAEIRWEQHQARIDRVALPACEGAGLVVRVAVPPTDPVPTLAELLPALIGSCPGLAELQLDLDIPTRRLSEYAGWVRALEAQIEPVPLTVTALPTWLADRAFAELALAADGYVLQLHWLPPEQGPLLDPDARAHLEQAARLGRPLRVALPAHGYERVLDAQGRAVGVAAEQGRASAPPGGEVVRVRAEPDAVAALVASLQADRPAALQQLVWFRLPTDQDRLAWSWPTLQAVRQGRQPRALPRVSARQDGQSWTVILHNDGEDDLPLPALQLPEDLRLAGGVGTFSWSARLRSLVPAGGEPLRPGEERVVGWVSSEEPPVISVVGVGP